MEDSGFIVEDKVSAENIGLVTIDNIFLSQVIITVVLILIIVLQLHFNPKYCQDISWHRWSKAQKYILNSHWNITF